MSRHEFEYDSMGACVGVRIQLPKNPDLPKMVSSPALPVWPELPNLAKVAVDAYNELLEKAHREISLRVLGKRDDEEEGAAALALEELGRHYTRQLPEAAKAVLRTATDAPKPQTEGDELMAFFKGER